MNLHLFILAFVICCASSNANYITGQVKNYDRKCHEIYSDNCTGFENCLQKACVYFMLPNTTNPSIIFNEPTCNSDYLSKINNKKFDGVVIYGLNTTTCDFATGAIRCYDLICIMKNICRLQKMSV